MSVNLYKQQGMTLLEVLVATAILAVVSAIAFMSIDNLVASKQALKQKNTALNQINLTQFKLINDLQMAVSNNQLLPSNTAEFNGSGQSVTLLRYANAVVSSPRGKSNSRNSQTPQQQLIRVRWYLRNDQLFRATQSAAAPLNSKQWQTQLMQGMDFISCSYKNKAGEYQSNWPNAQIENQQLPNLVRCELRLTDGRKTVLNVVPWQDLQWT